MRIIRLDQQSKENLLADLLKRELGRQRQADF